VTRDRRTRERRVARVKDTGGFSVRLGLWRQVRRHGRHPALGLTRAARRWASLSLPGVQARQALGHGIDETTESTVTLTTTTRRWAPTLRGPRPFPPKPPLGRPAGPDRPGSPGAGATRPSPPSPSLPGVPASVAVRQVRLTVAAVTGGASDVRRLHLMTVSV